MTDYKFKNGDRVILIEDHPDGNPNLYTGDVGTVCHVDGSYNIGIRYDKSDDTLHACYGACEDGHGWYTHLSCLAPYECDDSFESNITESDLISLIGAVV